MSTSLSATRSPVSVPDEFCRKPYKNLRLHDEFNSYFDRRYQRCQVAATPKVEGDRVTVLLRPISRKPGKNLVKATFAAEAIAEVYRDRTPPPKEADRRYEEIVLSILQPGMGLRSTRDIQDLARRQHGNLIKSRLQAVCNTLVRRGVLIKKNRGCCMYRLPLPQVKGLPVVENQGTRSERLGWVVEFKLVRSIGQTHPVVQWVDGGHSFSSDVLLEPAEDRAALQRIEAAKRGEQLIPASIAHLKPIIIPVDLLQALYQPDSLKSRVNNQVLLEVAELIGIPGAVRGCLTSPERHQVLDYLDFYYPKWRDGVANYSLSLAIA
ncbi:hypothetical protein IQ268_09205 [Oculatella sp. LEGE 06141]|uniref:hypothetical protein n=1 Tax=Oculatella sp. LEGE 06141 TaxID=1828648 RepID=UPI00187F1A43|nr:hypothetical protein [Oculatella sp. LEGE 06141]MBE9178736.1 hypothetical protein [Oculatella sp. LEGE 06141]